MCGIVYAHDFKGKPVNNGILDQFDRQRSRGVQGFGVYDGQYNNLVRTEEEDDMLDWLCKYDSSLLLFHHRFPTSTANKKRAAHPFTTKKHFKGVEYILVHNGHIQNAWKLKSDHEKLGIEYYSVLSDGKFNDSEALLWDVALYLEGKQQKLESIGAIAFVCIKLVKGKLDKLYFGRNNNPLNMFKAKEGLMLSSQGVGEPIEPYHLYTWNYKLKRLTSKWLDMPTSYPVTVVPYQAPYSWDKWDDEKEADRYAISDEEFEERYSLPLAQDEKQEATSLMLKYLMAQKGNFELAYLEMEYDYQQVLEDSEGYDDYRAIRIIEAAMEQLVRDPEYIDNRAISSMYTQLTLA